MFKQLYLRLRYWRQIRKGFGLLSDLGSKKRFAKVNDRIFVMNGHDPLVRVDLTDNTVTQYTPPEKFITTYKYRVNKDA